MVRYTKKQRDILHFIDKYGWITSKVCASIFYKGNKYGLTQARDTLNKLTKNKDITFSIQEYGKEKFYQFQKKQVTKHEYYILNLYADISNLVDKVDEFHLEQHWLGGKRRSDALLIFTILKDDIEYKKAYFIECDFTHKTDKEKYNEIYDSEEVQDYFEEKYDNRIFPDVIQLAFTDKPSIVSNNEYNVIGLDYNHNNLIAKIIC